MDTPTPTPVLIPARSKREAMDWALVLVSQEIEATITHTEGQWGVSVEPEHSDRAETILKQWKLENRGWKWRRFIPTPELAFQGGSFLWALAIVGFYLWSANPSVKAAGIMNSQEVHAGQWWRIFTAVTLHADMPHLISNATTGILLLGLAMARYGAGVALFTTFLSGAAANAAALAIYSKPYWGLGASGMVMGALGLLAVSSAVHWHRNRLAAQLLLRGVMAGFLILVLVGFSPETDVLAHVGGFVTGALFGVALGRVPQKRLQDPIVNVVSVVLLIALVFGTWWLALSSAGKG